MGPTWTAISRAIVTDGNSRSMRVCIIDHVDIKTEIIENGGWATTTGWGGNATSGSNNTSDWSMTFQLGYGAVVDTKSTDDRSPYCYLTRRLILWRGWIVERIFTLQKGAYLLRMAAFSGATGPSRSTATPGISSFGTDPSTITTEGSSQFTAKDTYIQPGQLDLLYQLIKRLSSVHWMWSAVSISFPPPWDIAVRGLPRSNLRDQ